MIKKLLNKYKSIIMYLFFGVCTTLVNVFSYYLFARIFKAPVMVSTIISWVLAVLFAYITNRKWVFVSKARTKKEILNEIISFFSCRLATGIVDWVCMYILVERLHFNDVIVKFAINILVIILNYIASKLFVFNEKNKKNKKFDKKNVIIYASFLGVAFIFLLKSPLHIWNGNDIGTDSSVFKTVSLMMRNGFLPYLDSFDHKGPLIYIINYFGDLISSYRGVFVFELLSLFTTACCFFKIARLKCNKIASYIIVILGLTLLFNYFEFGNLTEEYALPFISISLYIFLDYMLNGIVNKKRLLVCGASLGAVLMLRPNMISVWIVYCIVIFIKCIREKQFKELRKIILYFSIGMLLFVGPIIIWLSAKGILSEFFKDYILFNLKYTSDYATFATKTPKIQVVWECITHYFNNSIIIASYFIIAFSIKFDKKNIYYFIYMILTLFLACMSGRFYDHYMMIAVPTIIFSFSILFEYCSKSDKKNNYYIISFIVVMYLIVKVISPTWLPIIKTIPQKFINRNNNNLSSYIIQIINIVKEKTDENDKISVYGNWDIIYVVSNRMHATKYSYQFPISYVNSDLAGDYFEQLYSEKPKIIVIQKGHYDEKIKTFLDENKYKMIFSSNDDNNNSDLVFELNYQISL